MGQPVRQAVVMADFPGLATRPDSLDIPPGASVIQENLSSAYEGQLRSRNGVDRVTFEEE
jgi:hypothetical protein